MFNRLLIIVFLLLLIKQEAVHAQQPSGNADTFFLAKKKGLLGRLGKSISTNPPDELPQKLENPYLKFRGKIIRDITLIRLGFECSIDDTCTIKNTLGIRVANALHKSSTEKVIRNNLFFKEGGRFYPLLVADNERYLRDLLFIQDARIIVDYAENSTDSVDMIILTKDIFSLGGNIKIDTKTRGRLELQEENIGGSATRIFLSALYDEPRHPQRGYNGEITLRNIGGSFINWTTGYTDFSEAFSSGRREQTRIFSKVEKPLVTPYIPSTGALEAGYYATNNAYAADSLYKSDIRYAYYNIDGWLGYSLNSRRPLYSNREIRLHNFFAARIFKQHFISLPRKYETQFDYRYTNTLGALASINIFKQSFYKTSFIYGFGRSEDVPEGFSLALNGGWIRKQQVNRPYAGIDFNMANFNHAGFYSNLTIRAGGFFFRHRFEDVNLLFNVEHFTRLKKINSNWYQRTFISSGITAQVNPVFNEPLFLNSMYGLPYFNPDGINADLRSSVKLESVYYNTKKVLGFRFAPFVFTDFSVLKPSKQNLNKSDLFTAFGGGVRTRNENLVFGTVELKGYYFPRTNGNMNPWKIELSSNIRFKYNSSFIRRPDFVSAN